MYFFTSMLSPSLSEASDPPSLWEQVHRAMLEDFGEAIFKSWLSHLSLMVVDHTGHAKVAAPNRFIRDWIESNYGDKILKIFQRFEPAVNDLSLIVYRTDTSEDVPQEPLQQRSQPVFSVVGGKDIKSVDGSYRFGEEETSLKEDPIAELDNRFTFENFVVGKPNELAYAAARRVAESHEVQYNPLFLYSGVGLGKTHLMHAIAWHIRKNHPERRVLYLSAEKFMYQFIRALRYKDTVAFKELFRNVDVLMIDDVQFISGKDSTQEEFFHTFNALVDKNHQVIVSADKSPSDLEGMGERLKSRLGWGLVADIHPTNYELRLGILQAKAETFSTPIPQDVMEFLAFKISSNVRELEGALNRIVAHATLVGRKINLETTQDVLRDILKANDKRVTIDEIQRRVAEFYGIKLTDMQSSKRVQNIARPRQVAMYLSKMLTSRSLPEIGRKFGGRDHTTVIHAVKKVEELKGQDTEFAEDINILRKSLEN